MDHRRIDEHNVAELYVTGRLSREDEETFESHLLECAECRERVGWADDLRTSIRAVAAEDAVRASAQLGLLAWVSRRTRTARAGLLMAALLAVAALPAWLQADRARLARELEQARITARSETPQRPPAPAPAPMAPAPEPAEEPAGENTAELERLAREKSRLEEELSESRRRLARLSEPQINTRIVPLGVVRGESGTQIELGPSSELLVLPLELPPVDYDAYRVTLLEGENKVLRQWDRVEPMGIEINVSLYSDLLKPGTTYRFRLEGIEPGGRAVPEGEIPFRAVRR